MPMKLHEVHPALVHFPLAFFPLSLATDLAGRLKQDPAMMGSARSTMIAAAVSTAAAGVAGFIAQEEVKAGPARDLLVTHRTMNIGFLALVTTMASVRARAARPSWSYLAAGILGFSGLVYSAYLGGKMVYRHGVGVEPSGGVAEGHAPELRRSELGRVVTHAVTDSAQGVWHTVQDLADGQIAPALKRSLR